MQPKVKSQTNQNQKISIFSKEEMVLFSQKILKEAEQSAQSVGALVFALEGDLGSGKTAFAQGMAKSLGIDVAVNSPTFVIFKKYAILSRPKFKFFYHFDCYRLKSEKEIEDLGIKEILQNPQNIVVIEWAEKIAGILPGDVKNLAFKFIDENTREVIIG